MFTNEMLHFVQHWLSYTTILILYYIIKKDVVVVLLININLTVYL